MDLCSDKFSSISLRMLIGGMDRPCRRRGFECFEMGVKCSYQRKPSFFVFLSAKITSLEIYLFTRQLSLKLARCIWQALLCFEGRWALAIPAACTQQRYYVCQRIYPSSSKLWIPKTRSCLLLMRWTK